MSGPEGQTLLPLRIHSKADGQKLGQVVFGANPGHGHQRQGAYCFKPNPVEFRGTNYSYL